MRSSSNGGTKGKSKTSSPSETSKSRVSIEHANEDSESDVKDVHDETAYFMASKLPKAATKDSNKNGSRTEKSSLYERSKETFDDDTCDGDEYEAFNLTKDQLDLC
ncbi:hypothetical protein Tco_1245076 [Tanacetum coccineum]